MSEITGLPGVQTERTATPRRVRLTDQGARYLPGGVVIDGAESRDIGNTGDLDVLRAGVVMGKITSGGKYAPSIIGILDHLHDTSAVTTTFTATAAQVTEIQRRIGASGTFKLIGPPTAAGTVAIESVTFSAIATSTTITISATSADFAEGSIIAAADGTETPLCLIDDGTGIKVTDEDGANQDVPFPLPLIGGVLDASQIVGWAAGIGSAMDSSVKTWLMGQLNSTAHGGGFTFDDSF